MLVLPVRLIEIVKCMKSRGDFHQYQQLLFEEVFLAMRSQVHREQGLLLTPMLLMTAVLRPRHPLCQCMCFVFDAPRAPTNVMAHELPSTW